MTMNESPIDLVSAAKSLLNGTVEKAISDLLLLTQAQIHDGQFSEAKKGLKTLGKLIDSIQGKPFVGQVVQVLDGEYSGCILTFLGTDKLTGKAVCQHSDHIGGLRVQTVTPICA